MSGAQGSGEQRPARQGWTHRDTDTGLSEKSPGPWLRARLSSSRLWSPDHPVSVTWCRVGNAAGQPPEALLGQEHGVGAQTWS